MATEQWIESATRRASKPVSAGDLADDQALAGAGITYGTDDAESAAAERVVRRMLNRHRCQAPQRLAEAKQAGSDLLMADVRNYPAAYCTDPRHDEDAELLAEALQWLGLRPTPPPARRSDAITARPKHRVKRGTCPQCEKRTNLRADGSIGAHQSCPGEGLRPKEAA
ncbi:hypothetical protein E1264_17910 [Actinomadura sp. KC216]|uniref:hypothetical protein n=1 Tax=Actinomadura sp. KC216 TaxID=2530370 RepID=UPI0010498300|nr:hypothetical protein [Actinomadura sp. KC216]TDB86473.1 hypothetical protein E1264_17910 [Actinomadura sp. KC216]